MAACFVQGQKVIPYLEKDEVEQFFDVTLLSFDQTPFRVNQLLMASISPMLNAILRNQRDDDDVVILTDMNSFNLAQIVSFINHGQVYSRLKDKLSVETVSDFTSFGIDIHSITLDGVESNLSQKEVVSHMTKPVKEMRKSKRKAAQEASQNLKMVKMEQRYDDEILEPSITLAKLEQKTLYGFKHDPHELLEGENRDFYVQEDVSTEEEEEGASSSKEMRGKKNKNGAMKQSRRGRPKRSPPPEGVKFNYYSYRHVFHFPQAGEIDLSRPHNCNQCVRRFEDEADFEQHLRRHETNDPKKSFFCTICNDPKAVFEFEKDYALHRVTSCPGDYLLRLKNGNPVTKETADKWSEHRGRDLLFHFPETEAEDISYPYKCRMCIRSFIRKGSLEQHLRRHLHQDDPLKVFFCLLCNNASFEDWTALRVHVRVCEGQPEAHLPLSSELHNIYEEHGLFNKFDPTIVKIACPSCGFICQGKAALTKHRQNMGPFHVNSCATCEKPVSTWEEHRLHVEKEHNGIFLSRCGKCRETFTTELAKLRHRRTAHKYLTSQQKYKSKICEICGKEFSLSYFEQHFNTFHGSANLKCANCPERVFKSENALKNHMKHHNKNITCEICGYATYSAYRLKTHYQVKHLPDELKPFRCTICGKGYGKEITLTEHMYTHSNSRPFKCNFCKADFNSSGNLAAHVRGVHKGIKRVKQ